MRRRPQWRRATPQNEAAKIKRAERRQIRVALVAVLAIVAMFYMAFVKQLPFSSEFVLRGDVSSANELKPGSLVRTAGINIGSVTGVSAGPGNTSIVAMEIDNPSELRADASLAIEPRLLFEGNFYVNVNPGTPAAPPMRSGATIPLANTTTPVQIDQVLDVLDQPTRGSLKTTIAALAGGLGPTPSAAVPPGAGYQGLRTAARQLDAALPPTTQVASAALGTQPGDLGRAIDSSTDLTTELAQNPAALADLVTSYDRVFTALASSDTALADSVHGLDDVVGVAPPAFSGLDKALPTLTRFAGALQPALRPAPATLTALDSAVSQLGGLVSQPELPKLLTGLAPALQVLPGLEQKLDALFPLVTPVAVCVSRNVVPALDTVLEDGSNTTGYPAWGDLLHLAASLSGASQSTDGNGSALRVGVAEGDETLNGLLPGIGNVTSGFQGEGVRPTWLGSGIHPAFRPDQRCDRQRLPQINMANNAPVTAMHVVATPAPERTLPARVLAALFAGPSSQPGLFAQSLASLLGGESPSKPPPTRAQPGLSSGLAGPLTSPPTARPRGTAAGQPGAHGAPTPPATKPAGTNPGLLAGLTGLLTGQNPPQSAPTGTKPGLLAGLRGLLGGLK